MVVYYDYDAQGRMLHQWGSGTYPAQQAYNYDTAKGVLSSVALTTYLAGDDSEWSGASLPD